MPIDALPGPPDRDREPPPAAGGPSQAAGGELPGVPGTAAELRRRLAHVLWLGGSACAGKSSVARRLAERHGLRTYHCDDAFDRHRARATRERHPDFCRVGDLSFEEMWRAPVADQVEDLLAFYREQLEMQLEDVLALPAGAPLLVEGAGLLPARIAELVASPGQALWLVATPSFRRRHYPRRGPWVAELLSGCDSPRQAFAAWMERDDEMARRRAAEVEALGLPLRWIDGSVGIAATVDVVAAHFGLSDQSHAPGPGSR